MIPSLVLIDPSLGPIERAEIDEALGGTPFNLINCDSSLTLWKSRQADWGFLKNQQIRKFDSVIAPELHSAEVREIYFAGLTSIPTAVHWGYLCGRIRPVRVLQRHHRTGSWKWGEADFSPKPLCRLPQEEYSAFGDVVLCVSTSHSVNLEAVRRQVPNAIYTAAIELREPDEDAITSHEYCEQIADEFKSILDAISTRIPRAGRIHLFAAVPCGLAFMLGARISPTMHKPIQTYNYVDGTRYAPAIPICPKHEEPLVVLLSGGECARLREIAQAELTGLSRSFLNLGKHIEAGDWRKQIEKDLDLEIVSPDFVNLPPLHETDIKHSRVSTKADDPRFFDRETLEWSVSDELLAILSRNFTDSDRLRRALRMFFIHEALHPHQSITSYNYGGLGNFTNSAAAADYVADVYALGYEYSYTCMSQECNQREFLREAIEVAIETIWAFNHDNQTPLDRLELRVFQRLLTWYWVLTKILNSEGSQFQELFRSHYIEIIGLPLIVDDGRVHVSLRPAEMRLELGAIVKGRFERYSENSNRHLSNLVSAVSERGHEQIKHEMQAIHPALTTKGVAI